MSGIDDHFLGRLVSRNLSIDVDGGIVDCLCDVSGVAAATADAGVAQLVASAPAPAAH